MSFNIRAYINKNATLQSKNKGSVLFKSRAVQSISYSSDSQYIKAIVQGTKAYKVEISLTGNNNAVTSCTCPYNYEGICKHIIATLYQAEDKLKSPNKKSPKRINSLISKKPRNSNNPIEIKEYKTISVKSINNVTSGYVGYREHHALINKVIKEDFAAFVTEDWFDTHKVELYFENDKLFSKCSCFKRVRGLCLHQGNVISSIIEKYGNEFFDGFRKENIEKFKKETAQKLGFPENIDVNNMFKILLRDDGISLMPSGEAKGLVMPNKKYSEKNYSITKIKNVKKGIFLNNGITENENYELGFGIFFDSQKEIVEFIPVSGKLNKNKSKFINPIRKLEDYDSADIQTNSSDEELILFCKLSKEENIIEYIERHQNSNINNYDLLLKYYNKLLPKIWNLLSIKEFVYLFESNYYFSSSNITPIKISDKKVKLTFQLTENELFYNLDPIIKLGEVSVSTTDKNLIFHPPFILEYSNTLYLIRDIKDNYILDENIERKAGLKVLKSRFNDFFTYFMKPISENYEIDIKAESIKTKTIIPEKMKKQLYISEMGKSVIFQPFIMYGENLKANVLEHGKLLSYENETIFETERNKEFEQEYYNFLKSLHPRFNNQFSESFLHMEFLDFIKNQWFIDAFEKLKNNNIEVFGIENLKKLKYSSHKATFSLDIKSGQDWFDVNISLSFGEENVSLKDIKKAIVKQQNFVKLSDGKLGLLPEEWLEKLQKYFRHGQVKKDELKISKLRFSVIDELFDNKDYLEIMQEINEKKQKLKDFSEIKNVRKPQKLKGQLRDYQKAGYNWLNFLDEFKWGGILADDMGLGKTVQILAFLLKKAPKSKKASLIVLPTTLLFNWENEIEKFAPSLNAHFYYGTNRATNTKDFKNFDIIITTYGTLTRSIEILKSYKFHYIILDESQAIKNPGSQRFKATTLLKADNRLALTGTPIENNTFDLYAQMEFLNPGFLGTPKQFKENYSDEIDKKQNPIIAAELQNLINPFILRRTKEQVATELPPKTEDFIFCEMEASQRKVYDAFRNKYRNMLLNKIEEDGLGKSKIYVLEGLMKLRQICDSPEILSDKESYGTDSIKIKEIVRHIKEKTGKHKILIFSQFVKMLTVIKRELENEGISFEYLDGKSSRKARQQSVDNFQDDKKIRVFLISLKAGGTGLNLTAADYVYIVDPWWNPAVENQAIDRCYRIGQDKKVIAYRMICKNTIEEKIMKYQAKKQKIASDIISTDDSFVKQLDKSDIEDLFT